jgi:hypothetical protein
MVYCVQVAATFATTTARNRAQDAVNTAILNHPRWGVDRVEATDGSWNGVTRHALYVEVRFTSQADGAAVWSQLQTALGSRTPKPGSSLTLHTCTHDEDTDSCVIVETQEW